MSGFIEIQWSCASLDEARKVCHYLVQEKLVSCAQIIPSIESIYIWNNQVETAQESKVILKGAKENFEAIREVIEKNSSYQVPEILWRTIEGGNASYLNWMAETSK